MVDSKTIFSFDLSNNHLIYFMIKAFKIFKEGKTDGWVTILIPEKDFNDQILQKKIAFYQMLNYQITLI